MRQITVHTAQATAGSLSFGRDATLGEIITNEYYLHFHLIANPLFVIHLLKDHPRQFGVVQLQL